MTINDFATFYRAVHNDHSPFPWQEKLARQVAEVGWPASLSLPTAAGKTSVIDIAIFTLALEADRPLDQRQAPLRVFFVIDRRLVVDQAARQARILRDALERAVDPIVREVADALRRFGGPAVLRVVALRGGMYRDDSWTEAPNQPTICVTTIDQIGSRLLFRGYGLSQKSQLIHAGLAGNDALYIIDEAHLAQPFLETLEAVQGYRGSGWATEPIHSPFRVIEMSATPHTSGKVFELDKKTDYHNSLLAKRFAASKQSEMREAGKDFEVDAAALARSALEKDGVRVVGVVVNRVASARKVFDLLGGADARVLLTGRVRPWDRAHILSEDLLARMQANRTRLGKEPPLFVVATQTVEVGADLDFDFLITEAAPLASLRQRFGRLDRLGEFGKAGAVILRRGGKDRDNDPIYGERLPETWHWLLTTAMFEGTPGLLDFGVWALDAVIKRACSRGDGPPPPADHPAPVMLPAHVESWVQTSPPPWPDPDVAPFLHGTDALEVADVQIVWRADLAWEGEEEGVSWERWVEAVDSARPVVLEALPVRLETAKAWLRRLADPPQADVEGVPEVEIEGDRGTRKALLWAGPEKSRLVGPDEVIPGCTLVVPSTYGGADHFGWLGWRTNPSPVSDVGDDCFAWLAHSSPGDRRRPIRLRLQPDLFRHWLSRANFNSETSQVYCEAFDKDLRRLVEILHGSDGVLQDVIDDVLQHLNEPLASDGLLKAVLEWFRSEDGREGRKAELYPGGVVLRGRVNPRFGALSPLLPEGTPDSDTSLGEGDLTSLARCRIPLEEHLKDVSNCVAGFTATLRSPFARVLKLAGQLHDIGKLDFRFQAMLYGDLVDAATQAPLAKSGLDPEDRQAFYASWQLSGLPPKFRHEFLSVALVRAIRRAGGFSLPDAELDLLEVLIGTHHGFGRPWVPVTNEASAVQPAEELSFPWEGSTYTAHANHQLWRLDMGWTELFWKLVGRLGPWGLAYLEALLILADHTCSRVPGQENSEK